MNFTSAILFVGVVACVFASCPIKKTQSKLICYYGKLQEIEGCRCSHVILPANSDLKNIEQIKNLQDTKILITVNQFNQGLIDLIKSSKIDGLEINLQKLDSKNDINDFISTIRNKLGSDLSIFLSVPAKTEHLAKFYDFKTLSKAVDYFILQTGFLGASHNVTFHPSRLSGLWDMQNTDSVVDLVSGLGAPVQKLIITAPVQAFQFQLQSEQHTAPGSPALEIQSITRNQLCNLMKDGRNWTLERDQDQAGPYIFSKTDWIAFEDSISIDIKAKYLRVRGLAGLALKDLSQDGTKCESLLDAAFNGLNKQARAPRGAVLHSLEREILETVRPLDTIQVSPYRISRIIDVEGNVHVIRKDTRTEFECSRQGYFVHPRSCGRFYRCVKFDQLSDEFSVFEFDCPAGLAFDSRVEVCVWPGSLPHASPCSGSSEIAPVPRERFICPNEPGYYADPENCRWFFACLDHGKSPLSAYEFRCPFGLVYDQDRLLCEWPWLVPKCGSGYAVGSEVVYGGVSLEQYDGLGVLGATKLGGLQGPLLQPAAQIYSNVGSGLSLKATHTLQQAGLLSAYGSGQDHTLGQTTSNGIAYKSGSNLYGAGQGYILGQTTDSNIAYKSGQAIGTSNLYGSGQDYIVGQSAGNSIAYGSGQVVGSGNLYGTSNGIVYGSGEAIDSSSLYGTRQGSILRQSVAYGSGQVIDSSNLHGSKSTSNGVAYESGEAIDSSSLYGAGQGSTLRQSIGYGSGILLSQSGGVAQSDHGTSFIEHGSNLNYNTHNAQLINGLAEYESGTSGNINIIGGGYSSVGQITNKGASDVISYVTASPISVATVSTIPTVTSVPVPAIKAVAGFESYNGGVVANVPELQYKITTHGATGFTNISSQEGYLYPKPNVAFVEEPVKTTVVQENVPVVVTTTQRPLEVVQTYQNPISSSYIHRVQEKVQPVVTEYQKTVNVQKQAFVGYDYPKPAIKFEEVPVRTTGTSYSYHEQKQPILLQQPQVYVSSTPASVPVVKEAVRFHKQEIVQPQVQVAYNVPVSTIKPQVYVSSTPASIRVVEQEIIQPQIQVTSYKVPSPIKPVVVQQPQVYVTPTVQKQSISFSNFQNHITPQVQLTSYNVPSSTVKPVVVQQPQVYVSTTPASVPVTFQKQEIVQPQIQVSYNVPSSTVKPIVVQEPQVYVTSAPIKQDTIVSSFSISSNSQGYHYEKPKVAFVEQPAQKISQPISTYNYKNVVQSAVGYQYPKPSIAFEEVPARVTRINYQQPIVTNQQSYIYQTQSTVKPPVLLQKQPVFTSYNYQTPSTVKPAVLVQKQPVFTYRYEAPSTVKTPVLIEKQPVVTSYNYQVPTVVKENIDVTGYSYQKPAVLIQKQPVFTSYSYEVPSTVKPPVLIEKQPVVTSYNYHVPDVRGYSYQTPSTVKPAVLVQKQPVFTSYSYQTPSTVKPAVLIEKQPVVTRYEIPNVIKQANVFTSYNYQTPSTVKPAVLVTKPVASYNYEVPVSTTPKTAIFLPQQTVTSYPVKKPSVISSYSFNVQPQKEVRFRGYDYPKPEVSFVEEPQVGITYDNREPVTEEPFIKKTAYVTGQVQQKPIVVENYQVPISTQSYKFRQDSGYVYQKPVVQFEERPQVYKLSTTQRPVVRITQSTPRPTFATTIESIVTKQPWNYYDSRLTSSSRPISYSEVPVTSTRRPIEVTYLPVTQPVRLKVTTPSRDYLPVTTTKKPVDIIVEDYSAAKPSRDYLPVPTPVKIEKITPVVTRPKTIIKVNDYHPLLAAKLGAQCTCVSNTVKLRKKPLKIIVQEDDDEDDGFEVENYQYEPQKFEDAVIVTSTTSAPPSTRKVVRVRPVATTESASNSLEEINPRNLESAKFDRYGPGGWRSRNEKLQGTIDCQRAGLFRHPTQCNKFYACRWDCTKNRYTLHIFNCPVHLTFDNNLGACNWPSQGPACLENTLLPSD